MDLIEAGNIVIPLKQRRRGAAALDGTRVEAPDRGQHGVVVRVEDVLLEFAVAGDVDLRDAVRRHEIQIDEGVEAVVFRGHVDVVHVEKDPAIGALHDFGEELPFAHLRNVELRVAGDIFDDHGDLDEVLDLANLLRGNLDRLPGVGHGQQIVGVAAIDRAPAEMIAEPARAGAADEGFEAAEMLAVEGVGRSEIHGDAMLDHAVLFEDLVEDFERPAPVDHVVLRDDLEPVDDRLAAEDVLVMGYAQTDAHAVVGESVKAIGGHTQRRSGRVRNGQRKSGKRRTWCEWAARGAAPPQDSS